MNTSNILRNNIIFNIINSPFTVSPNRNSFVFIQQPRPSRTIVNCLFENGGVVGTYGTEINAIYDSNTIQGSAAGFSFNANYGVMWYLSVINNLITANCWTHGETTGSDGNVAAKSIETRYYFYTLSEYVTPNRSFLFRNNNNPNGAHFDMHISSTRAISDMVIQENTIANTEYAFKTDTEKTDYKLFDGLTFYNNDFDNCTYDYCKGILEDMLNAQNVNKVGDYCVTAIGESGTVAGFEPGDVNLDGRISLKDVTYIRYYIHNRVTLSDKSKEMGDMDQDGYLTMRDALLLREKL